MNEDLALLLSLEIPAHKPSEVGFLEIAGMCHYENVNSRIYAYFLNQTNEPKISNLFITALKNVIYRKSEKRIKVEHFWAQTEVRTDIGNKIDIVLEDENNKSVIIIENKIYHYLDNDLVDYWNHYQKYRDEYKIGILLTLEKQSLEKAFEDIFINVTHIEWIEEIKKIGLPTGINYKTYVYLNDFFRTIETLTKNQSMNELVKFYFQNTKQVLKAVETKSEAESFIVEQIEQLAENLRLQVYGKSVGWRNIWDQHNDRNIYYTIAYQALLAGEFRIYIIIEMNGEIIKSEQSIREKLEGMSEFDLLKYKSYRESNFLHFVSQEYFLNIEDIANFSEFLFLKIKQEFEPVYLKILDILDSQKN